MAKIALIKHDNTEQNAPEGNRILQKKEVEDANTATMMHRDTTRIKYCRIDKFNKGRMTSNRAMSANKQTDKW